MGWDGDYVRIDFDDLKCQTDLAYLIVIDDEEYWIPKSQVDDKELTGGRFSNKGWLTIPEWLAVEKNLV